jgi:hypothetical protein
MMHFKSCGQGLVVNFSNARLISIFLVAWHSCYESLYTNTCRYKHYN